MLSDFFEGLLFQGTVRRLSGRGTQDGYRKIRQGSKKTAEKIFDLLNTDLKSYESTKEFGSYPSNTTLKEPQILFTRIEQGEK